MTDLYLKFENEAVANSVLFDAQGDRKFVNIDVIGTILIPDASPSEPPVTLDGWHANVRLVVIPKWDETLQQDVMTMEDATPLLPYAIEVKSPVRVWA
jgi:hypothetical protein